MTREMIKTLFPTTPNIEEVVGIIEKYRNSFGLQTGLRLAHFLAQVREEVGSSFVPQRENLNYKESTLLSTFNSFRDNPELAEMYGKDEDTPKANPIAIANIAYANKLGNGNADSDNDGDMDINDDGYKYRGAGCLQITGKDNFEEVIKRIKKYAPNGSTNPDTLEGFVLFGMAFWIRFDIYKQADSNIVDNVTAKINKYTHSYEQRREHFNRIKHLIK